MDEKQEALEEVNSFVDPFISSLESSRVKDIPGAKKRKKNVGGKLVWLTAMLLCITVFAYCFITVVKSALGYVEADALYDSLAMIWDSGNMAVAHMNAVGASKDKLLYTTPNYVDAQNGVPGQSIDPNDDISPALLKVRTYLNALRVQNPDLVGWIVVDGTNINYPIVQSSDNEYYLHRSFDGKYSASGTIFVDYRNSKDFSANRNTVIYGHNMNSGTMFHELSEFFYTNFYKQYGTIKILTYDGVYVYNVFCVMETKITFNYIQTDFSTDEEYLSFINTLAKKSRRKKENPVFTADDRLLTLSTCTNAHNSAYRYCISAYLVEIQT